MSGPGQAEAARVDDLALDPFAFHRNVSSRIGGLGGNVPGYDPVYAFHTPYVAAARGPASFRIRFHNLRARRGTLVLRVHMLPDEPGATARLVNSARIQINRLVQNGGEAEIDFEGFRGFTFAVLGQVPDETDAHADGLDVTLDRPADPTELARPPAEDVRTTRFGGDALRPVAHLLSLEPPSLAAPVSQPCTAEQMREPAWADRSRELGLDAEPDPARWPSVYALQVLRRYSMLDPGARGLLLGDDGALAAALASQGGQADGADYLCSMTALHGGSTVAEMAAAVEASLRRLRPGGLAIHLLPLAAGSGRAAAFRRADLERLALTLISRRHEVAQFKAGRAVTLDGSGVAPFGLLLRRARSPL